MSECLAKDFTVEPVCAIESSSSTNSLSSNRDSDVGQHLSKDGSEPSLPQTQKRRQLSKHPLLNQRLRDAKCIIWDECSMGSAQLLELVIIIDKVES